MPLKLYKRQGSDTWHYRGTVDGRRLRGSTKTADKKIAQRITHEIESRAWKRRLDGPESVARFSDAVAAYHAAGKPTARFVMKLLDYWKETPIQDITASAVRRSCQILYPNGSNATWIRQVIVPTMAIVNHWYESTDSNQRLRVKRPPSESRERQAASWPWVKSFCTASTDARMKAIAIFLFTTGARISECLSVEWSDVDFTARTVRIRQTKTASERTANMPNELVVALANMPGDREGRIWKWKARDSVYQTWKGVCERAGIPYLSPHCLRHGFATALLQKGVDVKTVAELGGWKDAATVLKTYAHAMKDPRITDILTDTPVTPTEKYDNNIKAIK